jgi:hypothetical protein
MADLLVMRGLYANSILLLVHSEMHKDSFAGKFEEHILMILAVKALRTMRSYRVLRLFTKVLRLGVPNHFGFPFSHLRAPPP